VNVYRRFGLSRDPFVLDYDGALYHETRARRVSRAAAEAALAAGRSVWVSGPPGAGRQSFLLRLGEGLSEAGVPVVLVQGAKTEDGAGLLSLLYRRLRDDDPPVDPLEAAEGVYAALLDGLWRGGPAVLFPEPDGVSPTAREELELLASLRFLGRTVSPLALCGGGPPPWPDMLHVQLEPFSASELSDILRHRSLLSGRVEVLDEETLVGISTRASGVGDALSRAGDSLARLAYLRAGEAALPKMRQAAAAEPGSSLFSAEALGEVGRLLDAISEKESE
jgi:hypothetical protein